VKDIQKALNTTEPNKSANHENKSPRVESKPLTFESVKPSSFGTYQQEAEISNRQAYEQKLPTFGAFSGRQDYETNQPPALETKNDRFNTTAVTNPFEEEKTKDFSTFQTTQNEELSPLEIPDRQESNKDIEYPEPTQNRQALPNQNLPPRVFQPVKGVPMTKSIVNPTIQRPGGVPFNPAINAMNKGLPRPMTRPVINMTNPGNTEQNEKGGV